MKLYDSLGPNPKLVRMFAAEKGFAFPQVEKVDLLAGEHLTEGRHVTATAIHQRLVDFFERSPVQPVIIREVGEEPNFTLAARLVAEGHTNKEIAQELHLSTYTIKSHVHNTS